MAYDIFPKSEKELIEAIDGYPSEIVIELVNLYKYLRSTYTRTEIPINLDNSKKTNVNITRALQGDTTIDRIKSGAGVSKLSLKFGNGSSGNRGVNNRGNNFEPQFAYDLDQWWQGNEPTDENTKKVIKDLDDTYGLRKSSKLKIDVVGGENTRRPLVFTPNIQLTNTKGTGFNVGSTVTDITLTTDTDTIYLSLKLGTTTTFFNVGVRTILSPQDIKAYDIKGDGKKLLDLFGIDYTLFCDTFNGKLTRGQRVNPRVDKTKIETLLKSGIGYGYHIIHKMSGEIKSKKMDEAAMNTAARVDNIVVYYGGKTGTGKRIDIEMESGTYRFKLNIRDTQGSDGYPTRLMCDFSYK